MRGTLAHYHKLKSLSVTIVHHADFMADVKDSTDKLVWLAPRRFEITSDKTSVPKLACDGKRLTTFIPQVVPISEPFEVDVNRTKPWEARGGIMLSNLLKGAVANQLLHPEKPIKISFSYGKTMNWHGKAVGEIIETISAGGASENISFYLTAGYAQLFGTEVVSGPQSSWTEYDDIVENPDVPKDLGTVKT